jgi:hypothetical protein
MVSFFGLDPNRKRADRAAHFSTCSWILVEAKTRYKIAKAVEQLKETLDQIDDQKFRVRHLVVVYESLGAESRVFEIGVRDGKRLLWNKTVGRGGPVTLKDIEVMALKPAEIQKLYEQRRLEED